MIKMYTLEGKYLDICRSYQAMYDTPKVQADEQQSLNYLKMMVELILFITLITCVGGIRMSV